MSIPILTFFNNESGVGKTSLILHLAWMYAHLEKRVAILDLDPLANLTAAFLEERHIEQIWEQSNLNNTIFRAVKPLAEVSDIQCPTLIDISPNLFLLPGDIDLSSYEELLSEQWPDYLAANNLNRSMRILSSFWQVMQMAAKEKCVDLILVDIGANLGAINRSVLIASDYVVIPLAADLFSLQGLKNLGPTLNHWRQAWQTRLENYKENNDSARNRDFQLPEGRMEVIGYLCQQYSRAVKAYDPWMNKIPNAYRQYVLGISDQVEVKPEHDPFCLAMVKPYRSLIPMAQELRKPIFDLTSADGAIGSHASAAQGARKDFQLLAEKIAHKIGLPL